MASEILKITKIDVCLLGILIVSLAYQVRKSQIFRVAQERFRLNPQKYEQVILTICGIVRLRIGALILPLVKGVKVSVVVR